MGNRQRLRRERSALVSHPRSNRRAWLPLAALVLICAFVSADHRKVFIYDPTEARTLINALFKAIDPDLPSNAYFPAALRNRLAWVYTENKARRLIIDAKDTRHPNNEGAILSASWHQGHPAIQVFAPTLVFIVRIKFGMSLAEAMTNVALKDMLALSVMHETIHLELGEKVLAPVTPEQFLNEEVRAWGIMVRDGVRPLRELGHDLEKDFSLADDALKACQYRLDCESFRDHIRKQLVVTPYKD